MSLPSLPSLPLLPNPYAYIVCHDLKSAADRYIPFFDELKRSHRWWHYMSGTWIVLRYETLVALQAVLVPLIFRNDWLLIIPAKGPATGWLPRSAWEWINNHVPNEW